LENCPIVDEWYCSNKKKDKIEKNKNPRTSKNCKVENVAGSI
jgi:hypothetical protein